VNLVDANVLLYAINRADPKHVESRDWLDRSLNGQETVAFAWVALLAFLRLSTRVGLFPRPLEPADALSIIRGWLDRPTAVTLDPTARHLDVLAGLVTGVGTGGNLTTDAHLAALAVEHDATIVTYDSDFGRFSGVRWHPPENN
jgi:toxin-antitoxin system PIN domain toxin